MTRASFFAALLAPFLAALPNPKGKLRSLAHYGDTSGFQDAYDLARLRFKQAAAAHEQLRQEMLQDLSYLDGKTAAASEEGIEILSSWVDPNTGDTIALVLLKKNLQNSETPRTLLV